MLRNPRSNTRTWPPASESPVSNASRDLIEEKRSETNQMINTQIQKLHEMRSAQVAFFDRKMIELRQKEATVNSSLQELKQKEADLAEKQKYIESLVYRLKIEKEEILAIKGLLKAETESVQLQSRDLKRLVNRYEQYVKPMVPSGSTLLPD